MLELYNAPKFISLLDLCCFLSKRYFKKINLGVAFLKSVSIESKSSFCCSINGIVRQLTLPSVSEATEKMSRLIYLL